MISEPKFASLTLAAHNWMHATHRHYYTYSKAMADRQMARTLGGSQAEQLACLWARALWSPAAVPAVYLPASAAAMTSAANLLAFDLAEMEVVTAASDIMLDSTNYRLTPSTSLMWDVANSHWRLPFDQTLVHLESIWKDTQGRKPFDPVLDSRNWRGTMQGRFYFFHTPLAQEEWDHQAKLNLTQYGKN